MDAPCRTFSNWLRLPRHLHRVATCTLIALTIVHLHTRTSSLVLAGIFLTIAATGIIIDGTTTSAPRSRSLGPHDHQRKTFDPILSTSPKVLLALSLLRAAIYAFVGDVAAAQLLWNPYSEKKGEFEFRTDDLIQLGLAGTMWFMGAMLWVLEPTLYWVYTRHQNNNTEVDYERLAQDEMEEEGEEGETIIVWEEEFTLPTRVDFEKV